MAHLTGAVGSRAKRLVVVLFLAVLTYGSFNYLARGHETAQAAQAGTFSAYQQLFELSEKEKKSLTFYVEGQTIAGIVVKGNNTEVVEVRNQAHSRLIIRLDSVDAVGLN
jgi:hypothetical protein